MEKIVPNKLKFGDEVRVIAPSRSMNILNEDTILIAKTRLEKWGLKVSLGKNVLKSVGPNYNCATIEQRIEDLHDAFRDKNVKAILTVIGGYNSNQLLDFIDYSLIKDNPKILCGFSDITALANAIYAKTGLVTYSGPHFSSFGMLKGLEYTEEYFQKMFFENKPILLQSSKQWSNDSWFIDQENRDFIENEGMKVLQSGEAEGNIIGGNLCTLNLLQGTEYMPDLENSILFLEDDGLVQNVFNMEFDRDLQSLLQMANHKKIRGIVLGRAEKNCEMTEEKWFEIFQTKARLKDIPLVINANFGHTTPIFTFPIGGYARIKADQKIEIEIKDK